MSHTGSLNTGSLSTGVLIVGGGPAGAAAGYWLASRGHDVTIVERRTFPRDKTCGDALTPRAVHQLDEMGLGAELSRFHRYDGLRVTAMGRSLELPWPDHPVYPQHGYTARRRELDTMVAMHAQAAGARLLQGHEALQPVVERGFVRGATVQVDGAAPFDITARYVVVADGANSRFGRAVGTFRSRGWPYGIATRSYWRSPRHAEPFSESALDLRDRNGNHLPGYGWVFPMGDGTVNIGVGVLSTYRDFKVVNTAHLLDAYVHQVADAWQIDPDTPDDSPESARIPMGCSVDPKAGPTYLVVGDAAGTVSPFSGEGIGYAYETGRMAADVLHEALDADDPTVLQRYPKLLDDKYGEYFKVARLFARVIGRPTVMRELARAGMRSSNLMEWMLRIMSNSMHPDDVGPAEAAYRAATRIVKLAPNA